ncbi:MAG: hypothetical protein ACHQU0_00810 [Candidatus Paceibacteria bacterium]
MNTNCICGLPLSVGSICNSGGEDSYSVKAHCRDCGTTFEFNYFKCTAEELETLKAVEGIEEEPLGAAMLLSRTNAEALTTDADTFHFVKNCIGI